MGRGWADDSIGKCLSRGSQQTCKKKTWQCASVTLELQVETGSFMELNGTCGHVYMNILTIYRDIMHMQKKISRTNFSKIKW